MNCENLAKSGTESGHQRAVFCWAAQQYGEYPELRWMFAIPNGGKRDKITAAGLKAEGIKAGVPDIFLPIRRENMASTIVYAGMFIEMKKPDVKSRTGMGGVSPEQKEYLTHLYEAGYAVAVCYSQSEAITAITNYLNGNWI